MMRESSAIGVASAMPIHPIRLLELCDEIEATPHNRLKELDREKLQCIRASLRTLKQRVDKTLLRLAFVADRQTN